MTDDQFNRLFNALTELLDSIERVERISSAGKQDKAKSDLDDSKVEER